MKKKIILLFILLISFFKVQALNSSFSVPSSVSPGQNVTATYSIRAHFLYSISFTSPAGRQEIAEISVPNSEGGDQLLSKSFTFKAPINPGTYPVSINVKEIAFFDNHSQIFSDTKTAYFTVVKPVVETPVPAAPKPAPSPAPIKENPPKETTKSGLASLTVDGKTVIPKKGNNYFYIGDKKKVKVSGKTYSANDKVSGFGTVKTDKSHQVTVTAQNGTKYRYYLNFEKDNKKYLTINGEKYEFNGSLNTGDLKEYSIKIDDNTFKLYGYEDLYVIKVKKDNLDKIFIYGNKDFYEAIYIDNKLIINAIEINHTDLIKKDLEIAGSKVSSYQYQKNKNIYLVSIFGESDYYVFDMLSKKLVPFIDLRNAKDKKININASVKDIKTNNKKVPIVYLIVVLGILVIHLILDVILLLKKGKKNARNNEEAENLL